MAEHVGPIRISLSGTLVENKLLDLHSQFEYILPGSWDPGEASEAWSVIEKLHGTSRYDIPLL